MMKLGILGGGQLAQMMTQAAIALGIETVIFERKPDSPASRLTKTDFVGEWHDADLMRQFAAACDLVTLENEFVDYAILDQLEGLGVPVFPNGKTLSLIQDKLTQKQTLQAAGVPVPAFAAVSTQADIQSFADEMGWPLILKARRDGYDGYGNATISDESDLAEGWTKLEGRDLMVEAFVPFKRELAVMVVRGRSSGIVTYPVVETVQKNHVCHIVRAPADASAEATEIATRAVETVNGVGVFAVEMFELPDGQILFNEMAPRPHNSGHYTIETCKTSQFENHIRAVMGWSLGSTKMVAPAAVMVNLLGTQNIQDIGNPTVAALSVPNAHLHWYGKRDLRVGRKMGHVTVVGDSLAQCEAQAISATQKVQI